MKFTSPVTCSVAVSVIAFASACSDSQTEPASEANGAEGCFVARDVAVDLESVEPALSVRMPEGFVLGDNWSGPKLLFLREDGAKQASWDLPPSSLGGLPVGASVSSPRLVKLMERDGGPNPGPLMAQAISPGGELGEQHALGMVFFRGTMSHARATSLDGKRGVFTSGHIAADEPDAFMFSEDGGLIGAPVRILDATDFECLNAFPTPHGAAIGVSVLRNEGDLRTFLLRELDAGAQTKSEWTFDYRTTRCPLVFAWGGGLAAIAAQAESTHEIYLLNRGASELLISLDEETHGVPTWVGQVGDDRMRVLTRGPEGQRRLLEIASGKVEKTHELDLPDTTQAIAVEPGRLFATYQDEQDRPHLVEVMCTEAP